MILGNKSWAIPVHQTVEVSGKRKLRWEERSIGHREYDPVADRTEWVSAGNRSEGRPSVELA